MECFLSYNDNTEAVLLLFINVFYYHYYDDVENDNENNNDDDDDDYDIDDDECVWKQRRIYLISRVERNGSETNESPFLLILS